MVHTLRKYLSNRGSALFMVLSTMTALMVCCMAMYFSVVSSRSTQYAIFNQQQAYQSATSLSDTIIAGMISNKSEFKDISSKIWNLNIGEKITTNSNGFSAFSVDGSGNPDDDQVGAYMITIERLENETLPDKSTVKVFDIMITSSVNGTKEIFHNIIQMNETLSKVVPPGPTNPFTATGYVPNDVFLDCGSIRTDVFFDNQMTYGRAYGTAKMELFGDLSCGGSFHLKNNLALKAAYPTCFAVRDKFTSDATGPQEFFAGDGDYPEEEDAGLTEEQKKLKKKRYKNKDTSMVLIGGDCVLNDAGTFKGANVYVLGDLHLSSRYATEGKKAYIYDDVTMYVDGNVYIHDFQGHNLSQVYCNGNVIREIPTTEGSPETVAGKWTGNALGYEVDGLLTVKEMINKLEEKTSTNTYYKWEVSIPSGKEDKTSLTNGVVDFSANISDKRPTVYLEYTDDNQGVTIKDVTVDHPNNGGYSDLTLVIDTGDDPDNIYTVKLNGNRDYLPGPITNETFCWMPKNTSSSGFAKDASSYLGYGNNCTFKILVMGRGSVVFDIPPGVTYQDDWFIRVMHYGWYALAEGEEVYFGEDKTGKTKKYIVEHTVYKNPANINNATLFSKFVHTHCTADDGCTYTDETLEDECSLCGKKMIGITCDIHGYVGKYCEECQPNQFIKDETKPNKKRYECKCSKRVDPPSVNKYLADNPEILANHPYMKDSEGTIYPNVNIFLVSCDENANIRLSVKDISDPETDPVKDYNNRFQSNLFAGYIYAPYMTMKMQVGGNLSGGDSVRLMGGMTVSDYIIDDDYAMIAIWPDKIPEDMMPESCKKDPLIGTASKSWKIALKAH